MRVAAEAISTVGIDRANVSLIPLS